MPTGEYHTASAFGFWLAANIIKRQFVPEVCLARGNAPDEVKHVVLYNHYAGEQHSVMILKWI